MHAQVSHRSTCRLCESPRVELVVKLEPIPLSENYCPDAETGLAAARYPVDLYMCADCGHVQQLDVVDSKSLWDGYTYQSKDAGGMPEHFNQIARKLIDSYTPSGGSLVIDIGSNDGSLLRPFRDAGYRVLGIDPARQIAKLATSTGIETLPELISLPLAKRIRSERGPAAIVCMFNAFAHADNMGEVAESIRSMLADDGIFVFEAQYLLDIIDRMLIATVFHEHMSHHSLKPLVGFFDRHGLKLIDVERVPIQHGSLVGVAQLKSGRRLEAPSVRQLLDLETQRQLDQISTLRRFSESIQRLRQRTTTLVADWKRKGITVAGYGAARSCPTLISQLGLTGSIEFIFDDHPQKVGRYTSGDGILIVPTAELCRRMPKYTFILAWVHATRIIEANAEYLRRGGHFVVLCPEAKIISSEGAVAI